MVVVYHHCHLRYKVLMDLIKRRLMVCGLNYSNSNYLDKKSIKKHANVLLCLVGEGVDLLLKCSLDGLLYLFSTSDLLGLAAVNWEQIKVEGLSLWFVFSPLNISTSSESSMRGLSGLLNVSYHRVELSLVWCCSWGVELVWEVAEAELRLRVPLSLFLVPLLLNGTEVVGLTQTDWALTDWVSLVGEMEPAL